jgi:hypothetical protein
MSSNDEVSEIIRPLLKFRRETIVRSQKLDYALICSLERDPQLGERLKRLRTIPGVGPTSGVRCSAPRLLTVTLSLPLIINDQDFYSLCASKQGQAI